MTAPLLRQLLAVLKALLLASKILAKDTWIRLLRKAASLWRILRTTLRIGTTKKRYDPKKPGTTTTRETNDSLEKPTISIHDPNDEHVIPLDSRISCSRHPLRGPYLNTNLSQASLQHGLRAARSAHSIAVSSRNASRSNLAFVPSPEAQSFTFEVKGPDHPLSPTSPRRQYSLSSPQLGGSGSASGADYGFGHNSVHGFDVEMNSLAGAPSVIRRTPSSTPPYSITALPAGDVLSVHGSIHLVQLSNDRIYPIVPEWFRRYDRVAFAKDEDTELTIPAFTLDFKEKPDPPGWKSILHPEGILYFYNEAKRAVTEANLYDERFYDKATETISIIEHHIRSNNIPLPPNNTLALDINLTKAQTMLTDYYFADHDRKIIFFLDDLDATVNFPVWPEVRGVTSLYHIRHELEAQYWMHGMLYPYTVSVTSDRVNELRDSILHYIGDLTTSQYSTSPYNLADLNTMLGQVNSLKKNVGAYQGAASLLCRMNLIFSRQKFYNWHGLPEARIYRDKSVHHESRWHKTWLIKVLSPLLFSAPDVHLKTLEKMWVDGILHQAVWLDSIKRLNEEWQEFILYATVLLNANVAFLAIQSVDIHGGDTSRAPNYRSPTQVSCYLSIVSSIGSIILGLLLLRQNRTRAHGTANDVNAFLRARSHPTLGLETLAILYSLPYALLLWGMVSFLAAFAWNCFENSNIGSRVIMAVAWVAFAVLVLWCMWMGWVNYENTDDTTKTASAGTSDDVAAPDDAKSGTGATTPAERHGSMRAGAESRASRASSRASRPGSRLGAYPPVQARPGSRLSQMSRVSGAPVHVPMTPVREATMEPKVNEEAVAGAGASEPPSTGVAAVMRSLWSWPVRLMFPGARRRSLDSERTVTGVRPGDV